MTETRAARLRKEMGYLGVFLLWLIGRPLVDMDIPRAGPGFSLWGPMNWWRLDVTPGFQIQTRYAPNVIHRAAQRLVLGFRWHLEA